MRIFPWSDEDATKSDGRPLARDRFLATVDVCTVRRSRLVRVTRVDIERPQVHAIPALPDHLGAQPVPEGHDLFGLRLACVLGRPPSRTRYAGVYLRVCFEDRRVTVLALHPLRERFGDDGEGGTTATVARPAARERPPSDAGRLAYSSAELDGHAAGLFFGSTEPAGRPAAGGEPVGYLVQAVVSAPVALPELTGALRADVSVVRASRRVEHAHGREPARFALKLPGERTPIASPARPAEKTAPAASGVRLCFAADIERFSRFRTPEAARAQRRFVDLLDDARRHAGLPTAHIDLQRSGDGQFDVLPAALDESRVIPRLIEGLVDALAETNADLNAHARLRIRAALHRGHVSSGINGWLGESTIAVHRLLDSPSLRRALADHQEADLALIVSDVIFRDVIAHGYGRLAADAFDRVSVRLPDKGFEEDGWIYVPEPRR
ncbi:hypothetical protein [Actinomadura welshii]|uniref:hypothetical protein n=1 Tax=Actinomadura welshii TaxID=3103817 RepID=UPI0003ACF34C|nr:hypothetical protein [Actinomadura madurae]